MMPSKWILWLDHTEYLSFLNKLSNFVAGLSFVLPLAFNASTTDQASNLGSRSLFDGVLKSVKGLDESGKNYVVLQDEKFPGQGRVLDNSGVGKNQGVSHHVDGDALMNEADALLNDK